MLDESIRCSRCDCVKYIIIYIRIITPILPYSLYSTTPTYSIIYTHGYNLALPAPGSALRRCGALPGVSAGDSGHVAVTHRSPFPPLTFCRHLYQATATVRRLHNFPGVCLFFVLLFLFGLFPVVLSFRILKQHWPSIQICSRSMVPYICLLLYLAVLWAR